MDTDVVQGPTEWVSRPLVAGRWQQMFAASLDGSLESAPNRSQQIISLSVLYWKEAMEDKALQSTPVNLMNLVNYQPGSVVSRQIVKKEKGNVTLFAFDEGQALSEHTAPFDALVYVLEGESEVTISGKPHILKSGEMILMPAGEPHALKALKQFKMVLTMIRS